MADRQTTFGAHLPARVLPGGDPEPASADLLNQIADAAAGSGYSSLWITDHIIYFDPWMDCLMLLAAVAGKAKEHGLKIATGVVGLPLRHPVAIAQSYATLDNLCGGNLIIGVGEGSTQSDFDALGLPFDERRRALEDGVSALRKLLSGGSVTHQGQYYSFENVTVAPSPVQKPCPPIWLSSWGSEIGMRRVARLSDGWVASAWHSTPEEFRAARQTLDEALTAQGRDPAGFPNAVDTMFMYVDEDRNRARRIAEPIIEKTTRGPFETSGGHFLVGDPQECRDLLSRWIDAGAKEICVWPLLDPVGQVQRLGDQVLPGLL